MSTPTYYHWPTTRYRERGLFDPLPSCSGPWDLIDLYKGDDGYPVRGCTDTPSHCLLLLKVQDGELRLATLNLDETFRTRSGSVDLGNSDSSGYDAQWP